MIKLLVKGVALEVVREVELAEVVALEVVELAEAVALEELKYKGV